MKKLSILALTAAIIFTAFSVDSFAENSIKVIVNGENVDFTGDQEPVIQDSRTLVPLRAVFEKMGADVKWFEDIKLCEITYGQVTAGIEIGSNKVTVGDGSYITSDVPAQIINGRTMIPLRVISESIGAKVNWNGVTKTVTVDAPVITAEAPDSVEYEISGGGGNNMTTGLAIDYEFPVISSEYTMADKLNENIQNDILAAVDETLDTYTGDKKELYVKCDVIYNNAGLITIHYFIDNELFYEATYGIINGNRIDDDEIKGQIFEKPDEKTESPYYIETYSTALHDADGNDYISAAVEYPVFNETSKAISELNTQIESAAEKAADSFISSYDDEAKKVYENMDEKSSAIPYHFYLSAEVKIEDDTAEVTENTVSMQYGKDDTTTTNTYKINLNTGEIIE